ncbi:cytochrome P450 [Astrocystis sublimbata]|nr:cytochrome P450 [Astrocystis sublimbata]
MPFFIPLALAALLYCIVRLYLYPKVHVRSRIPPGVVPLPGPKSFPIVGRIHDVPAEATWLKFYEWSKEYGPIYQSELFGTTHVWISSEQIAIDLLSRRAAIYSDRPQIPNLPDNKTSGDYLALTGRNETWKRQRKLAQQLMTANSTLHDYPRRERDRFLYLLSTDPTRYREYIEQFTARTVARLSWGSPHNANRLRVTTAGLLNTISPSGALPNLISWLRHLPAFLSPWQREENARHAAEAKLWRDNVQHTHERMREGNANPSLMHSFLQTNSLPGAKPYPVSEAEASYVVGQMAIAGALTIGSPIQSFVLAMLHYPEWQKKLQDEIDAVCGGRCPQWEDHDSLLLLRACVKEVIRWRPPVPTGIPHALEKDDVYNGYFIPAGATIHALEWAITRDETMYPDGEAFNPARWLEPSYPTCKEPVTQGLKLQGFSQFGFGRRTCQGIPLVEQDLFLAMGGMAWAFDFRRKRRFQRHFGDGVAFGAEGQGVGVGMGMGKGKSDEEGDGGKESGGDDGNGDGSEGMEVPVHWNDYTPLLIAKPKPFEFELVVRGGEEKMKVLEQMWEAGKGDDDRELEVEYVVEEKVRGVGDGDGAGEGMRWGAFGDEKLEMGHAVPIPMTIGGYVAGAGVEKRAGADGIDAGTEIATATNGVVGDEAAVVAEPYTRAEFCDDQGITVTGVGPATDAGAVDGEIKPSRPWCP